MKIVVISDLHRGPDKNVDDFGTNQEKKFLKWSLQLKKQKIDLLLILGDLEELWQGNGWTEKSRLQKIYQRYFLTEKRFEELRKAGIRIQKIPGNHDWLLKKTYDLPSEYEITENNKKYLFLHGHQFDQQYKNAFSSFIGRAATEVWGVAEKLFTHQSASRMLLNMENFFSDQKNKQMQSAADINDDEYINNAVKYAKEKKTDVIIIGHTHQAKVVQKNNILYANSGTWIDNRCDFIFIDTKRNILQLNKW